MRTPAPDPLCGVCGRPVIGMVVYGASGPYHPECVGPPSERRLPAGNSFTEGDDALAKLDGTYLRMHLALEKRIMRVEESLANSCTEFCKLDRATDREVNRIDAVLGILKERLLELEKASTVQREKLERHEQAVIEQALKPNPPVEPETLPPGTTFTPSVSRDDIDRVWRAVWEYRDTLEAHKKWTQKEMDRRFGIMHSKFNRHENECTWESTRLRMRADELERRLKILEAICELLSSKQREAGFSKQEPLATPGL